MPLRLGGGPSRIGGLSLIAALGASVGCQAFFGVDESEGVRPPTSGGEVGGEGGEASHQDAGIVSSGSGGDGAGGPCECVGVPSAEWSGPFAIATVDPSQVTYACGDGQDATTLHEGIPPPHQCTQCSCASPTDSQCLPNTLFCFGNSDCTGAAADGTGKDSCAVVASGVKSCWVGPSTFVGGACGPSGGVPSDTSTWSSTHHLCPGDASDCTDGEACISGRACITRSGHGACPMPFTEQHLAWGGANDDRTCTPCSCGPAAGSCSGGGYELGGGLVSCNTSNSTVGPNVCASWGGATVTAYANWDSPSMNPGTCAPSQTTPMGTFSPHTPVTICCTPAE